MSNADEVIGGHGARRSETTGEGPKAQEDIRGAVPHGRR